MRLIYADYNPQTNSIDVTTFGNYILRIDCNKAEDGLITTPCSQNSLNALAIDEPLEYARLALDGEMQAWVDAIDSLEIQFCFNVKDATSETGSILCNYMMTFLSLICGSQKVFI